MYHSCDIRSTKREICYTTAMIRHLSGTVHATTPRSVIITIHGIGFEIFMTDSHLLPLKAGENLEIWTYMAVRENSIELFGFHQQHELDFFEMLLDVSGIGPRSALGIVGITSIETLKKAIANNDTSYLTKVSGIGKKTAEKIVVELKDKLANYMLAEGDTELSDASDVLDALQALGYTNLQAREALQQIPDDITETNERIKKALQIIGNNT